MAALRTIAGGTVADGALADVGWMGSAEGAVDGRCDREMF